MIQDKPTVAWPDDPADHSNINFISLDVGQKILTIRCNVDEFEAAVFSQQLLQRSLDQRIFVRNANTDESVPAHSSSLTAKHSVSVG